MGVPFCGFPAGLVEALVSPSVVKIVSDQSTRFCSHGVAQPDGFSDAYTLLSTHLKVDFQCVCSIHQLALFVGLPVPATPNPGQLRLLYYRLITRGEVAVPPHLTPSLLGVLCAALLAGVYQSDGHAFDVNSFQQLLRDAANGGDALMIRNMRLRIERYGVRCAESLSRKSCEIMLQQLLSEHGPEICFMDRLTNDLRTIPGATDAVVSGQLQVQDGDEEYIGELLRDDCSSTAAGSHDEDMEQKEAPITDDVPISIKKRTVESYGVENGDNSVMKNTEKPHKTPIHCRETASPEQGTGVPLTRSDGVGSNGNFELGNKTVEFVLSPPGFSQNFEKKSMGKGSVPLTFSKRQHNRPAALTEPRATGDFTSPALRPSVAMEGDTLTERCAGRTDGDPKHIESDGAFIERLTREVLMDTMEKQCAMVSRPVAGLRLALGKKV
ncbi:unnamed protein product [Trypanosoma congolense IL3000]|uniref:WGS project CAEQ00000000 data, annotated contig 1952 n=1 Tax=Trypanosoma congolense (strain IL3000) TaxID=1068625 RepID=F9WAB8_TRYCI|nr:unnamed protein product [Trypanosoma congolense IL3000]